MTLKDAIIHERLEMIRFSAQGKEGTAEYHNQIAKYLIELNRIHNEIDDADDEDEIFIGYLRKIMKGDTHD